ncbi:UNVERIFIED_CONTAM: hypothetical protein B566_EDAN018820 [Ephemera danica]|nr:hypothetical protein B566_EDAN018820 [Ephemera danica]
MALQKLQQCFMWRNYSFWYSKRFKWRYNSRSCAGHRAREVQTSAL